MSHCISPSHSDFFNYPSTAVPIKVWEVSSTNPCTSVRTVKTLNFNPDDGKYYLDYNMVKPANGYYFISDAAYMPYVIIRNGISGSSQGCPVTSILRKSDFGIPTSISRFGNKLLCAYAEQHIVMLYDTSTGTNPIGTIVAGQMNNPSTGYASNRSLINAPMLVQWRDDGLEFAVYSGGSFKSIKTFKPDGNGYMWKGCMDEEDQWGYAPNPDPAGANYNYLALNSGSLVDMLTAKDTNLNDFWLPTTLQYVSATNGSTFDTIYLGVYRKDESNYNHYKIYAVALSKLNYFGSTVSLTGSVSSHSGLRDGSVDIIRGFAATRKKSETISVDQSHTYGVTLTVVAPRSWSVGGNDRYRNYEVEEVIVWTSDEAIWGDATIRAPSIRPKAFKYKGKYRINKSNGNVWKNNVKAEVMWNGGNLVVVIKSSTVSCWDLIKHHAMQVSVPAVWYTVAGLYALSASFKAGAAGFWTAWGAAGTIGSLFSIAGIVVAVVAVVLYFVLKPPKLREVGTSIIIITYSGDNSLITWQSGAVEASAWINNDHRKFGTLCLDTNQTGNLQLYSVNDDGGIYQGEWNAEYASSEVLRK